METQTEQRLLQVLVEMRNWMRLAVREPVRRTLEAALPDAKSRSAYQMFDGTASFEQVRVACKMSPNAVVALAARCVSMGIMEVTPEKKRVRLFDLGEFDLLAPPEMQKSGSKNE